jgi:hypothetical protein
MTQDEREMNVMLMRKNSTNRKLSSQGSFVKSQSKATQSLTNLMRHRSSLLEAHKNETGSSYVETDDNSATPALDKLANRFKAPQFGNRVNESKPVTEEQVKDAIE